MRKLFVLPEFALLALAFVLFMKTEVSGDGISAHGRLSVKGAFLVDGDFNIVHLRGMSSHGLTWYPLYINQRSLGDLRSRGANLFRAAMYTDGDKIGGYASKEKYAGQFNKSMIYLAVESALAQDMYVIADWHILGDGNPLTHADKAAEFFGELSARYKDEPGVLYEICNEPNGDTAWGDIAAYAQRIITIIRKNSPDSVIIVGTPKYSQDIYSAMQAPLDFKNIMYAYHFYTGQENDVIQPLRDAASAGMPVFVT